MADIKFWRCNHCGNIVYTVQDGGVTPVCCGEPMELLVADSTDAATEKHVPVVTRDGDDIVVHIGSADHPMLDAHYIQWAAVVDPEGNVMIKYLKPGEAPELTFNGKGIEHGTAYEYCNLHGLWKREF